MSDTATPDSDQVSGFDSLQHMESGAAQQDAAGSEVMDAGIGLVDKPAITEFTSLADFFGQVLSREGCDSLSALSLILCDQDDTITQAVASKSLPLPLFFILAEKSYISTEAKTKLLLYLQQYSGETEVTTQQVGESVTIESPEKPQTKKYLPLPQRKQQWNEETLCRFLRYEAKVLDLTKNDDRLEYSRIITEWKIGFSPFKVIGRKIVFSEMDKSVFLELEYYEFLNLEA